MQGLRVNVSGTNLWTWTPDYKGWDPETGGSNLPPLKYVNVGLTVNF
jgi:hypothetical protein